MSDSTSLVLVNSTPEPEVDLSLDAVTSALDPRKHDIATCQRALLLARDENGQGYDYGKLLFALRKIHPTGGSLKTLPWYASKMKKSGIELPKRPRFRRPKNRALPAVASESVA